MNKSQTKKKLKLDKMHKKENVKTWNKKFHKNFLNIKKSIVSKDRLCYNPCDKK